MGGEAHVLLAAGDDQLGVSAPDGLRREVHGLEAAAAHLVDGHRRHAVGKSGLDARLTRRILPAAGGQHLPEDHFVDLLRLHAAALEQPGDDLGAEAAGRNPRQLSAKRTDRGAGGPDDDDVFSHVATPWEKRD